MGLTQTLFDSVTTLGLGSLALYSLLSFTIFCGIYVFVFIPIRFVYRVYFDPLSHIPGPKFELISRFWHQIHWFVGGGQGKLVFRIGEWHKKYGPIVRVSPDEVHILDIDSYNQIFKVGTKFPKNGYYYSHPSTRDSLLALRDFHAVHLRRAALQPYFSKQSVRKLESLIQSKVSLFLDRLYQTSIEKPNDHSIDLSRGFRCLACDIITTYSYEKCFDALSHPTFAPDWLIALEDLISSTGYQLLNPPVFAFFNWFFETFLPRETVRAISPNMAQALDFSDTCRNAVLDQKARWNKGEREMTTIFEKLFQDDEKTGRKASNEVELAGDAILTVAAGMDTTGHTLTMATYYLIKHPEIQKKLLAELKTVLPTPHSDVSEEVLEKLPYLGAVIKESLRFSHGTPGPLPRDVPPGGTTLCGYYIPADTITLNSHYLYHSNPEVFPDPLLWNPERWLVEDTREMEKYFMPFSRGARICVGMNLAMAELAVTIARMVRRFEMRWSEEFKEEYMEWIDVYLPVCKGELTVVVKEREE